MPAADLVIQGTVLTVNELEPTAEALAVSDGRIVAVGDRSDVESWIGPETQTIDLGDGCVMPGFVEAHGVLQLCGGHGGRAHPRHPGSEGRQVRP